MSTIDLSRQATDFRKHYAGVRMQQGRILTDDDFNEASVIAAEEMRRARVHAIGAYGTPDAGFLPKSFTVVAGRVSFTLSQGSLYLGGLRLDMNADESFHLQRDWLNFNPATDAPSPPLAGQTRTDLVWIEAWQQPVTAVEDSELFEVALGGPDTTTRWRTMRRVIVSPGVSATECADAWTQVSAGFSGTMTGEMQLATAARLSVSFTAPPNTGDICSPSQSGGYLGAENQAIRVQMVSATHYTWGFDNAAPLYRVQLSASSGQLIKLKLLNVPKDAAHWPLRDTVVELLPWSAALPNGERAAELAGHLCKVSVSYNPDDQTLEIDTPVPATFGTQWKARSDKTEFFNGQPEDEFFYMRVWMRGDDLSSPAAIPIASGDLGHTGLSVTFSGGPLRAADYWIIAARPAAPEVLVPWVLTSAAGIGPNGVLRYRAPVGLIQWTTATGGGTTGTLIHDCRPPFMPLTKLRGCCTVTVGDGTNSFGQFTSIQMAIAALPPSGGVVCVLPGLYTENLVINGKHDVRLHGCGDDSKVQAATANPVIRLTGATRVRIEGLHLSANNAAPGVLVDATPLSSEVELRNLTIRAATRSAIEVQAGDAIRIRDCFIVMADVSSPSHGISFTGTDGLIQGNSIQVERNNSAVNSAAAGRGGLHLGGTSERVRVLDNLIRWGIGNGITLGTIRQIDASGQLVAVLGWVVNAYDPCSPCLPGSVYIPPGSDGSGDGTRMESVGPLYRIEIEGNRILDMGLNGIGVIGFFDLAAQDEFITVVRLGIVANEIRGCLQRTLEVIPAAMLDSMGYGGISLADVEYLVVRDNVIESNGPDHLQPVCGIFVLHGEGIEIVRNRILHNGAKTAEPSDQATDGRRGGINIVYGVANTVPVSLLGNIYPRQDGVPAIKIHDNIVSQPLGQALSLAALGPVSVVGNQFTSLGMILKLKPLSPTFIAACVLISNLGQSNEIYGQVFSFDGILNGSITSGPSGPDVTDDMVVLPRPDLDDQRVGQYLANGNVLFANNQCVLDLIETGLGLSLTSILITSLDDVAVSGNQCDCNLLDDFLIMQALVFGFSVRVDDNRLKEGIANALYSAITLGFMNATSMNQSTHCLLVASLLPTMKVDTGNKSLIDAFSQGYCARITKTFTAGLGGFSEMFS